MVIYGEQARIVSFSFLSLGAGLLAACPVMPAAVRSHADRSARWSWRQKGAVGLMLVLLAAGMLGLLLSFAVG